MQAGRGSHNSGASYVVHGADGAGAASAEQQLRVWLRAHALVLQQVGDGGRHDARPPERIPKRRVAGSHIAAPEITRAVSATQHV